MSTPLCDYGVGSDNQYLIENLDHFKSIVMMYGKNVFKDVETPDALLNFILNNFLNNENTLYKEDVICDLLTYFITILDEYFKIEKMEDLQRCTMLVSGTFGNIYTSEKNDRVYKMCKIDSHTRDILKSEVKYDHRGDDIIDDSDELFIFGQITDDTGQSLREFMFEIINYIIWTSIALYIDNQMSGSNVSLTHFIIKIYRPFMIFEKDTSYVETGIVTDDMISGYKFRCGYEMERCYCDSLKFIQTNTKKITCALNDLESLHSSFQLEIESLGENSEDVKYIGSDINEATSRVEYYKSVNKNTINAIMNMMDEFRRYDKFGITLVHRDASPKNVVIVDTEQLLTEGNLDIQVKFVDLASLQTYVVCRDGSQLMFGHYFDQTYNSRVSTSCDIVFYLLYTYIYNHSAFVELNIENQINKLLRLNKVSLSGSKNRVDITTKYIDTDDSRTVWLYPYKINFNYEDVKKEVDKIIDDIDGLLRPLSNRQIKSPTPDGAGE